MENFDPIDVDFLINSDQVKKDAKKVRDELRGISSEGEDASKKVQQQIKEIISENKEQLSVEAQAIEARKKHIENLRATIQKNHEAYTKNIFQTDADELKEAKNNIADVAEEVVNLGTATEETAKKQDKASSSTKGLINRYLSWTAAITLGLELLKQYGPEIKNYLLGMFNLNRATEQQALAQNVLNKSLATTTYKTAIADIIELRNVLSLAKDGAIDKTIAIDKYNKIIGDTAGKVTDLASAEQGLIDNGEIYLEMMFKKAAANLALEEAAQKAVDAEKRRNDVELSDFSIGDQLKIGATVLPNNLSGSFVSNFFGRDIDIEAAKKKAAKAADVIKKEGDSLNKIYQDLISEAEAAAQKLGKSTFGDGGKDAKRILEQRKKLLQRIADIDAEFRIKQLDTDAEELQALQNKFEKVRALVEDFNKDPKNAKVKIDLSAFDILQEDAEKNLKYTQETKKLKQELEAQKQLFEDFEEYKKQFGIAKAKEQFVEQLKEFNSYAEVIRRQYDVNAEAFAAVAKGTATGGQSDRVKLIEKEADAEIRLRNKQYADLLAALMDYEEKRNKLINDYKDQRELLLKRGNVSEAQELDRQFKISLGELDDEYAKSTDAYKALIRGVENLSDTAARAVISNAKKMVEALLAAGTITADTVADINKKINSLEDEVDGRTGKKLDSIANKIHEISAAFLALGDSLESYDQGLSDTITTIGELGNVAGDAVGSISKFASGDIAGGIASGISALAGLFTIGAKARESARQAQAELVRIQQENEDGERRLNEIMRQRNIAKSQEVELTLKGVAAQREALQLAQQQLLLDEKRLLHELHGEDFITGSRTKKYGGFLGIGRKTKVVNDYSSLLGLTFEEIEKLYEKGKLEDRASELFEQLRRLKDEGEDINALLGDLEKQSAEIFTGTTSNALADSIVDGLKQGYDSFEDFATSIEGLLQGAILNSIKYNVLEEPLQNLYEQFAKYAESEGGLSQAESDAIRAAYQEQVQKAIDQYEQLSGILDKDLLEGQKQTTGLQGAIRRELTEETASELTGLFRGQFDITKRHFQLGEKHFELEQRHFDATMRMVQLSALIEQNTAGTVTELKAAVLELRTISKNTKPSQTSRDLGLV